MLFFLLIFKAGEKMNIKKVDDKPMVIHRKEKAKLHIKTQAETKSKERNVSGVEKEAKIAGVSKEDRTDNRKLAVGMNTMQPKRRDIQTGEGQPAEKGKISAKEEVKKSAQKEAGLSAQYKQSRQDREKAIGKKNSTVKTAVSAGATAALEQMDGGSEIYDSCQAARTMAAPAASAADAGGRLHRTKAGAERIKKVQKGRKIGKKAVKDGAVKSCEECCQGCGKRNSKRDCKESGKGCCQSGGRNRSRNRRNSHCSGCRYCNRCSGGICGWRVD